MRSIYGFKRISVRQRPDSEQILLTGTKYRKQNSVSVEEIQDSPPIDTILRIWRKKLHPTNYFIGSIFQATQFMTYLTEFLRTSNP